MSSAIEMAAPGAAPVLAEDQARADLYALLARLFYAPPDAALLRALAGADERAGEGAGDAPIATAWHRLQAAAAVMPAEAAREEFDSLFVGVDRAAILPYASYYLTGFLMETPLAELRGELARLGLARFPGVSEPEDHIASLADVMRFLIAGDRQTPPAGLAVQKQFFRRHVQPWYGRLAADIQDNKRANFYRHVAALMQAFFAVEVEAFEAFETEEEDR